MVSNKATDLDSKAHVQGMNRTPDLFIDVAVEDVPRMRVLEQDVPKQEYRYPNDGAPLRGLPTLQFFREPVRACDKLDRWPRPLARAALARFLSG